MLAFVALSAALAVLQNAPALAIFGSVGGFLAPVLTSTGQGSHVALFSYYVLLNVGIFGIAWFRAWRMLNWIGFVFTFVVATVWGSRYDTAEHFSTIEPFLLLFTFFYIAITVLFATRQPPQLRGLVDGSLVFGVPIVAFGLQSRLVREMEFVLAYFLPGARRCLSRTRYAAMAPLSRGNAFVMRSLPRAWDHLREFVHCARARRLLDCRSLVD